MTTPTLQQSIGAQVGYGRCYKDRRRANTFTPNSSYILTSYHIYAARHGLTSNTTLRIREARVDNLPLGTILNSVTVDTSTWVEWPTFDWAVVQLTTPFTFNSANRYCIELYNDGEYSDSIDLYSGTCSGTIEAVSDDNGDNWATLPDTGFSCDLYGLSFEATTLPATGVSDSQATLNGSITGNGSAYFQWATDAYYTGHGSTYDHATAGQSINSSNFSQQINGLTNKTVYHFRAVGVISGTTYYGSDLTFTTSSIGVYFAFDQSIFTASPTWTDVTEYVRSIHIKRGRMHELDRIEAGTATVEFKNDTGYFWRYNNGSPFYIAYGKEVVKPVILMKIEASYSATTYSLFYGVVEAFKPGWADERGGRNPIMTCEACDFFKTFNRYFLSTSRSAELSGTRINNALDEIGWPAGLRTIDAGKVTVSALTPPAGGTNAMEHLFAVAKAEGGNLFIAGDGKVTFQDSVARTVAPLNTSQATFTDAGTDSYYVMPELSDDDTWMYNYVYIKGAGAAQLWYDSVAITSQGERDLSDTSSLIQNESDAFIQAYTDVQRYKDSILRCMSLQIEPKPHAADLFPKVWGYELSTRITFNLNSAINPAIISKQYHIEAIEHSWIVTGSKPDYWTTKWQLWDVNPYQRFNPGHSGYLLASGMDSYNAVHEAANADGSGGVNEDTGTIYVGQEKSGITPTWKIYRGCTMLFDTTTIDMSKNILGALLILHQQSGVYVSETFNLCVVGDPPVNEPLIASDYGALKSKTIAYAQKTIPVGTTSAEWLMMVINSTGLLTINKGGTTTFNLRSSLDILATEPGDGCVDWIKIDDGTSSYKPILVIVTD